MDNSGTMQSDRPQERRIGGAVGFILELMRERLSILIDALKP